MFVAARGRGAMGRTAAKPARAAGRGEGWAMAAKATLAANAANAANAAQAAERGEGHARAARAANAAGRGEGQARGGDTRALLLETALGMFHDHGYDAVTVGMISEAVGISKNTFYYYFKSKEDLLTASFGTRRGIEKDRLTDILLSDENYFEQFWMLMEPPLKFAEGFGSEILKLFLRLHENKGFIFSYALDELEDAKIRIIEKAQAAGEVRNPNRAAVLFEAAWTLMIGALMTWAFFDGSFDLREVVRAQLENCYDLRPDLRRADERSLTAYPRPQAPRPL
jgi:AcrR family transcriptional regulator